MIGKLIIALSPAPRPTPAKRAYDRLQLLSAAFMAYNHGLNDGQKFMGVFALTMLAGGATDVFEIPLLGHPRVRSDDGDRHELSAAGASSRRWDEDGAHHVLAGLRGANVSGSHRSSAHRTSVSLLSTTTHTITTAIVGASASVRTSTSAGECLRRIVLAWA